jgi:hypothetical protein
MAPSSHEVNSLPKRQASLSELTISVLTTFKTTFIGSTTSSSSSNFTLMPSCVQM